MDSFRVSIDFRKFVDRLKECFENYMTPELLKWSYHKRDSISIFLYNTYIYYLTKKNS